MFQQHEDILLPGVVIQPAPVSVSVTIAIAVPGAAA